jgi:HemY protein
VSGLLRYLLIGLILGLGLVLAIRGDAGYVLIVFQGWSLETTVWILFGVLILGLAGVGFLLRVLSALVGTPATITKWRNQQRDRAQTNALEAALKFSVLENPTAAADPLKRAFKQESSTWRALALVKNALARGDFKRAETLLSQAQNNSDDAETEVTLKTLQAELAWHQGDFIGAKNLLAQVVDRTDAPLVSLRLALLVDTQLGHHKARIETLLNPTIAQHTPAQQHARELLQSARAYFEHSLSAKESMALYRQLPKPSQQSADVTQALFDSLLGSDDPSQAVSMMQSIHKKGWPVEALRSIAHAPSVALHDLSAKQTITILGDHKETAIGHLLQGRIAAIAKIWGVAKTHLETSYQLDEQAFTARSIAQVYVAMNDEKTALHWFSLS